MTKLDRLLVNLILTFCLVHLSLSDGGKYDKSANEERPFRINKLNYIWSKAVRQLERPEQKRLQLELNELDVAYLAAKDAQSTGKDRGNNQLIDLDKRLRLFLRKLDIENILDSLDKKAKWTDDHGHDASSNEAAADDRFSDKRLTELWESAKKADFTQDELKALREEFYHHEKKVNDYNDRAKEYNKIPHENSVHVLHDDDAEARLKAETKKLKQEFRDVQDGYQRIAEKIGNSTTAGDFTFTNPRVKELWQQALNKKSFSKEELDSIKQELKHFEGRLEKLRFLENEVSLTKESMHKSGKKAADSIDHQDVASRFDDLSRKVKKHEDYIASKISHSEL